MTSEVVLRLDQISRDLVMRVRSKSTDEPTVRRCIEVLEAGHELPAIQCVFDGANYWLWDGFIRWEAHKRLDKATVQATVVNGSYDDAVELAGKANTSHGQPRSLADVSAYIGTNPGLSESVLSRRLGLSVELVSQLMDSPETYETHYPRSTGDELILLIRAAQQISNGSDHRIGDSAASAISMLTDSAVRGSSGMHNLRQNTVTQQEMTGADVYYQMRQTLDPVYQLTQNLPPEKVASDLPLSSRRQTMGALNKIKAWIDDAIASSREQFKDPADLPADQLCTTSRGQLDVANRVRETEQALLNETAKCAETLSHHQEQYATSLSEGELSDATAAIVESVLANLPPSARVEVAARLGRKSNDLLEAYEGMDTHSGQKARHHLEMLGTRRYEY